MCLLVDEMRQRKRKNFDELKRALLIKDEKGELIKSAALINGEKNNFVNILIELKILINLPQLQKIIYKIN